MPGQAKILSPKEIESVFKILDTTRDKTLFALGIYSGMRIGKLFAYNKTRYLPPPMMA
ncbi:MAG TPA: hypothetical protein V6C97_10165 [Oculatellaceae cyanobacterium]